MNLVPIPVVSYRCSTCGLLHDTYPETPCCDEPTATPPAPDLYTITQVAERTQVSKSTVQGWINRKLLPAVRIDAVVRIRATDLDHLLTEHATA